MTTMVTTTEPHDRRRIIREAVAEFEAAPGPAFQTMVGHANRALAEHGLPAGDPDEIEAAAFGLPTS